MKPQETNIEIVSQTLIDLEVNIQQDFEKVTNDLFLNLLTCAHQITKVNATMMEFNFKGKFLINDN